MRGQRRNRAEAATFCSGTDCVHAPLTTGEIFKLSWPVKPSTAQPGSPYLEGHNDALSNIQAYLNGKAIGSACEAERRYLLALRLEFQSFHVQAEDPE